MLWSICVQVWCEHIDHWSLSLTSGQCHLLAIHFTISVCQHSITNLLLCEQYKLRSLVNNRVVGQLTSGHLNIIKNEI